jgi:hypothetical protein
MNWNAKCMTRSNYLFSGIVSTFCDASRMRNKQRMAKEMGEIYAQSSMLVAFHIVAHGVLVRY